MNIQEATRSYEKWMRKCTTVIDADLRSKHEQMREDNFLFFRGTFYRWIQVWPEVCAELRRAPKVLAAGDLHVGSFGTWRDGEGRLAWGATDFDECCLLPYTNDLVRLAASVKVSVESEGLTVKSKNGCDAILEGYWQTLKRGGRPIVLAEHENNLERLGFEALKPPDSFWRKLNALPVVKEGLPHDAKKILRKMLPDPDLDYKIVRRKAGMGSLGQQRFVAIADWEGGFIAREAKAMAPSACVWLAGGVSHCQSNYQQAISGAVRSHDPFQKIVGRWLIRRLSPDADQIEIADLPRERDEETLLHAMGAEAANVHLGTRRQITNILNDLRRRKPDWLQSAAKKMAKAMKKEWKDYKKR
ncbi:MAG: DUF2252 family protein [Candidatus Acidiferrales bacterium]